MIWVYPEQLSVDLKKKIKSIYVLFGNDLFLLQNSQFNIVKAASNSSNVENFSFKLNNRFDWNDIFNLCKIIPLFPIQKILSLHYTTNYPFRLLKKNIPLLYSLIHKDLILIILIYTSNLSQQQQQLWKPLYNKKSIMLVNCITPNSKELEQWIINQAKHMKMNIEHSACQLLCYYYEGNNIVLLQTLQYLSLVYPDGNLSYLRIKKILIDSAYFDSKHWIEAILLGNKQRANRILKKIIYVNGDLNKLLNQIQYEILIIIQIKYNSIQQQQSLHTILLKKYKIYAQHRRTILSNAIHRLNSEQLNQAISLLIQIELKLHQNCIILKELHFKLLTEILCYHHKQSSTYNLIYNEII